MKKRLSFVSVFLVLIMIISASVPALALDADKYEERNVTAYIFGMTNKETVTCLFNTDLPDIPYIDAVYFLNKVFVTEHTLTNKGNGVYTVSGSKYDITVDAVNDTVVITNYEQLLFTTAYCSDASLIDSPYIIYNETTPVGDLKPLYLDLAKYNIDITDRDGKVYLPVCVLNDIVCMTYIAAVYIDGVLYFFETTSDEYPGGDIDRSPLFNKIERTPETAEFSYNELCFKIDNFFGCPPKAAISESVAEKGFDRSLDEYSEKTRLAKELLKSTSLVDFYLGLSILQEFFADGGHGAVYYDTALEIYDYTDTELYAIWEENYGVSTEDKWVYAYEASEAISSIDINSALASYTKEAYYDYYRTETDAVVREWEGDVVFLVIGNTAVFTFDSFDNTAIEPFIWSLEYAKENGLKNFIIDISTNGGGSTGVLDFILAAITNKDTHTSSVSTWIRLLNTNNMFKSYFEIDLNLDGVYDEKDKETVYDFNFAFITSAASFSSGNYLPVLAKEKGIAIIGETSGGGTCCLSMFIMPEGQYLYFSSMMILTDGSGNNVDGGAEVDYDLTVPFSNWFDIEEAYGISDPEAAGIHDYDCLYYFSDIGEAVEDFYRLTGDINDDGEANNKDVVYMFDYVSASPEPEYFLVYDFNGDTYVDNKDIVALFRYLSTPVQG